ncbi:MAG: hypothetical protein Q8N60_00680 [Candidatus Diapherotrites archaeon]|nr:hypothetical protein [Candidatus Diapherotrites archaeon]
MAKILFIVNEHPTEAFAISVAREAAERLRAAGHTVVRKKVKFKDTLLGWILKNPNAKLSERTIASIYDRWDTKVSKLIQKYGSASVYDFHCTQPDDKLWSAGRSGASPDFRITPFMGCNVVEIKAHYRNLPERILQRTEKARKAVPSIARYLDRITSQALTRQKGLTPEEFGKAIAKTIDQRTRAARKPRTRPYKGIVKRVFPKIRQRKIHRRIPRA